ncbi:MAG: AFG1 family ATPase, partial [Methylococcales bacterium]|nr:AFG1 family ATPase [Methylococcales bacterium]
QQVFSRLLTSSEKSAKSVYIFGDVGRGKSMLMDVFFEACPIDSKRRVHFHAFMQEVHEYMHHWRGKYEGDPLPSLAVNIRQSALLFCFDEFHVTDIADAMLLSRLFTRLFNLGVVVVATSNQHPDDLYKNGLQRELFLPFIALLTQSADILELVAKEDYRLSHFKAMKTTFYSEPEGGYDFLQQSFNELTNDGSRETRKLLVKGRELNFQTVHGDILLTSFNEICGRPLGPADYLAIASEFSTILIADIPSLSIDIRDQVRRFVTLIDALYEQSVKLICTSVAPPEQLYLEMGDFNFKRTRSRLIEMQSERYLQRKHLG